MPDLDTVPTGWRRTTLGELGRYINGRGFKKSEWSKAGRPIIRIQDLTGSNRNPHFFEGEVNDKHVVRPGDLLVAWSATLGAYIWNGPEAVLNQHIFKVESRIDPNFHYQLLRKATADLQRAAHGSGIVHVTKSTFDSTPVTIPQDERVQRSLARLIDHVDSLRHSADAHILQAQLLVKRIRTAAFGSAFRDAEADVDGSGFVTLESLLAEPMRNGYSAQPVPYPTDTRVLTLTATTSGWFDDRHFKYTDQTFGADSPFWLLPGDIVIQRGNTADYVGTPALYDGPPNAFIYPDLMIRVRPKAYIQPKYLWYMLSTPQARDFLRQRATGSAGNMPKVNQQILKTVPIPVASEVVRRGIVDRLEACFALVASLEQRLVRSQTQIDLTEISLLAKAFKGELILEQGELSASEVL
jgi:type I restriction enzyme S subunit